MVSKTVFDKILSSLKDGQITVDYWGEERKTYGKGKPSVTLILKDPKVVTQLLRKYELGFGEAYMDGRLDVEDGTLDDLLHIVELNKALMTSSFGKRLNYRYERNTKNQQKRQVQSHYDLGNDFYKLWLDDTMTYTCAYYRSPKDSLETAQRQKIDHVLRKLQLKKGQEFLDIGCGWGHLVVRAAKLYGAKGLGVTISHEQYVEATALAKREGVSHLAKFKQMNYQDLLPSKKQYDRIISVGIFEHVGKSNQREYFDVINTLLKPGGVSVLHSITQITEEKMSPWIDKYIFPAGYIPSQRELLHYLPEYNFRLMDLENLRPHYVLTLNEWLRRFEKHVPKITKMYDERFVRMWRLYLYGSSAAFNYAQNELTQIVFTKGIDYDYPLTRESLYK